MTSRSTRRSSPTQIKVPAAGAPQTILLIGSDHRAGEPFKDANTDTMLLVRLDAASSTINVMSLPRDLEVNIPGYGTNKLNAAYSEGGWNLLIKTVKQNVFPEFVPNHIIDVNFSGFADLVNAIGCVYSDIDHRYYNQSQPAPSADNYASINIQPGYQKLCGGNNETNGALSFARFRHTDTDLTREARQQDFIRWAKSQYPISRLLSNRDRAAAHLRQALPVRRATAQRRRPAEGVRPGRQHGGQGRDDQADSVPGDVAAVRRHRPDDRGGDAVLRRLRSRRAAVKSAWARFIAPTPAATAEAEARPPRRGITADEAAVDRRPDRRSGRRPDAGGGAQARRHAGVLPASDRDELVPTARALTGNCDNGDEPATAYAHSYPRAYSIIGPGGKPLPRLPDDAGAQPGQLEDEYYGVQGTTWDNPPILSSPSGTKVDRRPQAVPLQGRRQADARWPGTTTATPTGSRTTSPRTSPTTRCWRSPRR